jgi:putative ABC transport system substrate-binding protein
VGLRDGLVELGYRENEDFVIGIRFTQGDVAALPAAARALVQYGVDLIFASEATTAKAAQQATRQIPIVFAAGGGDPVALGLVQDFARPGGNITGVTMLDIELGQKRLELFREVVPGLKRVLYLYDAADTYASMVASVYRNTARALGMVLVERMARSEEAVKTILSQIQKDQIDGILAPVTLSLNIPGYILEMTSQRAIPTMFDGAFWVERDALVSYGTNFYESGRRAARLVDKILKGANPAEIPVEVNEKIEFAINLKTAKALELTIPPEVLYQADKLIR